MLKISRTASGWVGSYPPGGRSGSVNARSSREEANVAQATLKQSNMKQAPATNPAKDFMEKL